MVWVTPGRNVFSAARATPRMDDHEIAAQYWDALGAADGAAMGACYAEDATFQDPVFLLQGAEIGTMWRNLMNGKGDLIVETGPLIIDGATATGRWQATYTFPATGRRVVNRIRSTIEVRDGRIVAQRDRFGFWRWSAMALGAPGMLLGWTPMLRNKVRRMARKRIQSR